MAQPLSLTPLWQENWREPADGQGDQMRMPEPPTHTDVLVIGGGYTGLAAARETAVAGLRTVVLDAGAPGAGCSGRNGGQVAYSLKPSLETLTARVGRERALAIRREGFAALEHLRHLIAEPGFDAGFQPTGGFVGAHTRRHYERMARAVANQPQGLAERIRLVPREEQHGEIATDLYHGGCVHLDDASIDPMRMLASMRRRASAAGAMLVDRTPALRIDRERGGFLVTTATGATRARCVLLATNGYPGRLSSWHGRRVVPIGSYQIATEPLGSARVRALIPHGRHVSDTRRVVVYFRPSPDGERLVFGGRAALAEQDPRVCVPRLTHMLRQVFPQLEDVRITHAWAGFVAYTFDTLPHLGEDRGLFYCMGYCGQGVPLAPYLGMRVGRRIANLDGGSTAFDGLEFPARAYHRGRPWFLAPAVWAYRWLDRLGL